MTNLTPEQQAVIDAAVAWHTENRNAMLGKALELRLALNDAVRALLTTPEYREKNDG